MPSVTHIVPVLGGRRRALQAGERPAAGSPRIYVQPINYPTVPRGTERLRLTPTPLHCDDDMTRLVAALQDVWQTLGLGRSRRRGIAPKTPTRPSASSTGASGHSTTAISTAIAERRQEHREP